MSVRIGSVLYISEALKQNPALLNEAFHALCRLPETPVSPVLLGKESEPNRIIIKEKEMMLKRASDPQQLIGTVDQWACCTLYAWDENDAHHGLIHVSESGGDLRPFVALFEDKKNVQVILVGGRCNNSELFNVSKQNILSVLKALIQSRQEFTFVSQRVMTANKITPQVVREHTRELLIEKTRIYYKKMLNKPMPDAIAAEFSANDFINYEVEKDKIKKQDVLNALYKIINFDILMEYEDFGVFIRAKLNPQVVMNFENYLIKMLRLIFTDYGYDILAQMGQLEELEDDPYLINFSFDTKTKVAHQMIDAERDGMRQLFLYDPARGSRYTMAFNGGRFHIPNLSQRFRDDIIDLYPHVKRGIIDSDIIKKIQSATSPNIDKDHMQVFAGLVLDYAPILSRSNYTVCTQLWSFKRVVALETLNTSSSKMPLPFYRK